MVRVNPQHIRVTFMGTPELAATSLRALAAASYNIVMVVTQPDRPLGRSGKLTPPAVKQAAQQLGLPTMQPEKLRPPEVVAALADLQPDITVVAAYGEILRPNMLAIPRHGNINLHASLLPKYRGASPISAAILNGAVETGVTIMLMDAGMDTGPMLAQHATLIGAHETTPQLTARLADIGAELLIETLPRYLSGAIAAQPQDNEAASYTRQINKDDGRIDWQQAATQIERMVRAYYPWPSAFTEFRGKRLKVLSASVAEAINIAPGHVQQVGKQIIVGSGSGGLVLQQVQLEGKQAMEMQAFISGQQSFIGSVLGQSDKGEQLEPK